MTGKRGAAGAPGTSQFLTIPSIVLSDLHKQIESIYNELEIQMKRMAQVQGELDEVREGRQRQPGPSAVSRPQPLGLPTAPRRY